MVHLFSNGDCLYATTIAKQIKVDFPGCHLTWIISSACKKIIFNNPFVDAIEEVFIQSSSESEQIFNNVIKNAFIKKQNREFDEIFVTQILGDNFSNYDSCVRTSIYRCYGKPITVDKTPILILSEEEIEKASSFANENNIRVFKNVILFECAPQSGQAIFSEEFITHLSQSLVQLPDTCIILSSAKKIDLNVPSVFDGSVLSIRETVALSHHCNLLIGCSSGITWAATSTAGKHLPMVQLLNKDAYIYNPPSISFKQINLPINDIIELFNFNVKKVVECVSLIFMKDFESAKQRYNQPAKKQFRLYRGITHTFLEKGKLHTLKRFIKMNISEHGYNFSMLLMIMKGFILFPIQLFVNKLVKK